MRTNYEKRLKLPIVKSIPTPLFSMDKELLAHSYDRIVIGQRGPYIEINSSDIVLTSFYIPTDQMWRIHHPNSYYVEYRSLINNVKLYYQSKQVDYADYKIGYYYISPFETYFMNNSTLEVIIEPLKKKK